MKKRSGFMLWVILTVFSLICVVFGIIWARKIIETDIQSAAVSLLLCGGMVFSGIALLVNLSFYFFRKSTFTQKETEALQKKNEALEALNQQTQQLAHHQRLEIIGTLTSSIAHEFNNLLTPIMGYSLMALEKLPPEEGGIYDDILEIYNTSRKAKEIISRLSDLARKNPSMAFRPVSPDDMIHKTLHVAAPAKPENTEIRLDLNCWEQRILANEIQISQLLLNLILNGFHAIGERTGVLTIKTSFDETHIHISISDTGCGIPEDVLPKIFDPFFTTKEPEKGTGLGLAIVAQVVEDHSGSISVESKVNEGTTIAVSLSRVVEPTE